MKLKLSQQKLYDLGKAVQEGNSLTTAQWKIHTAKYGHFDRAVIKILRTKTPELRKKSAVELYGTAGGYGDFYYIHCHLSDEALDRCIASF